MSEWGDWSACSVTCGVGQRVRKRRYHNPMVDENMCGLPVMETENCIGSCRYIVRTVVSSILSITTHSEKNTIVPSVCHQLNGFGKGHLG